MKAQNILLVDDDLDDQMLFIDAVKEIDPTIQCHVANNGLQAMLSLRTKSPAPGIIFLDLNMPKMSGYECLAEIKKEKHFEKIPVVIYSTSKIESEKERTIQMGAKHFFTKPPDFTLLKEELSRILNVELEPE